MRIVSLLSSATEIVHLLGLDEALVAISHECDFPPQLLDRPRASRIRFDPAGLSSGEIDAAVRRTMQEHGSVYEVDAELLERLRPDLVLTQAVCEVCAVPTGSVEAALRGLDTAPRVVSLDAHTLDGILDSVQLVAEAAGVPRRGELAVSGLRERLRRVDEAVRHRPRKRVLMLEWLDPPFAPGHWVPEMVDRAGGDCQVGAVAERSIEIDWCSLEGMDPDVLLIEPCGYDLSAGLADADRARERLRAFAPRAIDSGSAWVLDSALFSRSGPRVVDGVELLAGLLHPELPLPENSETLAARWR